MPMDAQFFLTNLYVLFVCVCVGFVAVFACFFIFYFGLLNQILDDVPQ